MKTEDDFLKLLRAQQDATRFVPEVERSNDPGTLARIASLFAPLSSEEVNRVMREAEDEARGRTPREPGQNYIQSREPSLLERGLAYLPEPVEDAVMSAVNRFNRSPVGTAVRYASSPDALADLELGGPARAASFIFNTADIGRAIDYGTKNAPGVVGNTIDRLVPPRGVPADVEALASKENIERLARVAEGGIKKGGHLWYDLDPMKRAFVDAAGEEGAENFYRLTRLLAATSPRAKVDENIRRATYFNQLINDAKRAGVTPEVPSKGEIPNPFGHLAHKSHEGMLREIFATGDFTNPIARPKATSFAENLYGNLEPVTVDTHHLRNMVGEELPTNAGVRNNAYGSLEQTTNAVAEMVGLKPAATQSAIWVEGADKTNVADPRNFVEIADEMARRTADQYQISPSKLLEALATGRLPLLK